MPIKPISLVPFLLSIISIIPTVGCGEAEAPQKPEVKPLTVEQDVQTEAQKEAQKDSLTEAIVPSNTNKDQNIQNNKTFDPLEGKSLKDICSATGLSLIKWPYATLQENFTKLCCTTGGLEEGLAEGSMECDLDWPFSDVPSCSAYDELRNEIFARYGRGFSGKQWQQTFGATDWYTVRKDFSNDWLTDVANQNVATLVELKKDKVACMD